MNSRKSTGPKTLPWGTPLTTGALYEVVQSTAPAKSVMPRMTQSSCRYFLRFHNGGTFLGTLSKALEKFGLLDLFAGSLQARDKD